MANYRNDRIRQLAHEIWEREGHPHGRDAEHWRIATEAYETELTRSRRDDAGEPMAADEVSEAEAHDADEAPREWSVSVPPNAPAVASQSGATVNQPVMPTTRRTKASGTAAPLPDAPLRRGRKPKADASPAPEATAPTPEEVAPKPKRSRRTKAEMLAAAAATVAAAAVIGTVAVTKRQRGNPEAAEGATAGAAATPRRGRKPKAETAGEVAPVPAADAALKRPRKMRGAAALSEADSAAVGATSVAVPDPSVDGPSDMASRIRPDTDAAPPSEAVLETFPESAPEGKLPGE